MTVSSEPIWRIEGDAEYSAAALDALRTHVYKHGDAVRTPPCRAG